VRFVEPVAEVGVALFDLVEIDQAKHFFPTSNSGRCGSPGRSQLH
jgi:hypothetical protein